MATYLTTIQNSHDVLLKLGLPLIVSFLSGWIIIRAWVNKPGIDSTGFSPAATAALFAPMLLVTYFFVLQAIMLANIVDQIGLAMLYAVISAPTFLALLPVGIISLVRASRQQKPLHNGLLSIAFAAWPILQVAWMAVLFRD